MEATKKRYISPTTRYDNLFPKAGGNDITIKRSAELGDTMTMIPQVVQRTKWHTTGLAMALNKKDLKRTCRGIWDFVYKHIDYCKDESGYEQVRSPARSWKDRFRGVDCDCYSVFISSILCNLGIPHLLRITKYGGPCFQHIYPVVIGEGGQEIILDCVTNDFDYEVPYTEKKDFPMELQYLNGPGRQPAGKQAQKRYTDIDEDNDLEGNWEGRGLRGGLGLTLQTFIPQGDDMIPIDNWTAPTLPGITPLKSNLFTTDTPTDYIDTPTIQPVADSQGSTQWIYPEATIPVPQVATLAPYSPTGLTQDNDPRIYTISDADLIPGEQRGDETKAGDYAPIDSVQYATPGNAGEMQPVQPGTPNATPVYPQVNEMYPPATPIYAQPTADPALTARASASPRSATCTCTWNQGEMGDLFTSIQQAFAPQTQPVLIEDVTPDPTGYAMPVNEMRSVTQPGPASPPSATCTCTWNEGGMGNLFSSVGEAAKRLVTTVTGKASSAVSQVAGMAVDVAREVVDVVTRFIPDNAMMRTAFLSALKLNILNIARRLRWAYVPKQWFIAQGGDPLKYDRLRRLKLKVENIFRLMGGEPSHILVVIATGKGNQVSPIDFGQNSVDLAGFGALTDDEQLIAQLTMREILGPKMFDEELFRGNTPPASVQALADDPVIAGISAILSILTVISTILDQLGPLVADGATGIPAMTIDFDPALTTAAENNFDDPGYISAYTTAMGNMGDLSSFQTVGAIDLTKLTSGPFKTMSSVLNLSDSITSYTDAPLNKLTSVASQTIRTILPTPADLEPATGVSPGATDYIAMMNPAAANTAQQTASPVVQTTAEVNTQSSDSLPVIQAANIETPAASNSATGNNNKTPEDKQTWFQKNKTLVIAGSVGVGAVGLGLLIYFSTRNKAKDVLNSAQRLNGPGRSYRRKPQPRQKYISI